MVADAPIDLAKTYKVVTNNFVATGGDGYKMLKDLAKYDTGYVDADATMEYIQNLGKVDPKVEDRITVRRIELKKTQQHVITGKKKIFVVRHVRQMNY